MQELTSKPPLPGISSVQFTKSYFDIKFTDGGHHITLVHLGGALPKTQIEIPRFGGGLLSAGLPVNHLSIADPNTSLAASHSTGWYSGHQNFDAMKWIPKVVSHFAGDSKIIYFGSSAGGYGALVHSARTANSSCIAVNPRTALYQMPSKFPNYASQTFRNCSESDVQEKIEIRAWDPHRIGSTPIWYLQNRQDTMYWNNHYLPFRKNMKANSNVHYIIGDWGKGHVVPPRDLLTKTLRKVISETLEA